MSKQFWRYGAASAVLAMAAATGAAAAPPTEHSTQLDEVIVTAQKVRSNVQTTPLAVQTVAGDLVTTAGINDAKDLGRLVSSLTVQPSGGSGSSFFIRGVGNANGNATTDNGVAVSLDQMYFSRQFGPDLVIYDVDRIEVLKGPQGTLYGRNATGGVVNIVSQKPTFGDLKGYARVEFGNYGEIRTNAAVNAPISDTLALRLAEQTNKHDGYLSDGYDDADTKAVRAHLMWKPTSKFSLLLSAEYEHSGGKGQEAVPYVNNKFFSTSNPWLGGGSSAIQSFIADPKQGAGSTNLGTPSSSQLFTAAGTCYPSCLPAGLAQTGVVAGTAHPYQVTNNGFVDTTIQSFRADMEWDLGFATLSAIPAELNTNYRTIYHNSPASFYNSGSARQQSLELRLASPQEQRFTWLVGAFGQQEKQDFEFIGVFGAPLAYQGTFEPNLLDRAGGIFAQTQFKILPNLTLTTGARYSAEEKTNRNAVADNAGLAPQFADRVVAPINREDSGAPTYRLALDWRVTRRNLLYASFATGFHSGGLQQGQPPTRALCKPDFKGTPAQFLASVRGCDASGTYLPEKLKAYTIGSKNRFFDNHLQVNAEIYDWDYTNLQVGTLGLINPDQSGQVVTNAGTAHIKGMDLEMRAQLTSADEIGLAANYNYSRYGLLETYNYVVGAPFAPTINNLTGTRFGNAPDLTATADYHHIFDLPDHAALVPSVAVQYSSKVLYSLVPYQTQSPFAKVDLTLTYHSPHEKYEVQLFVRNVTDVATLSGGAGRDTVTGLGYVFVAPPRTFGASIQANF